MNRRAAGIQTPVQECGPSTPLPADHVLGSGAVLFPGVFDQYGCPLVIFPADGQDRLLELSKAEVVDFINYFHALFNRKYEKQSLVSVVVDLRNASPPTPKFIMESLLLVQEHKRTIHSVYMIQPKKKDVVKPLLKLLDLSTSCSASFKTILLREFPELWNYIDRSQLPASLGGYFLYCHRSWVSFIREIHGFVQEFLSVVQRLPSCISTLQALSRLPLPSSFSELQHFCCTNEAKFLQLRRELGLDELLKYCEAVCEKLRHPDREPCYQAMVGTPLFTQTAFEMLQNHSRITAAVDKVELLWQQAFSKAHLQLQVLQLRHGALQIIVKMESLQEKLQLYKMEMAKDSATAETVLSEFEASISTPAMALVRCAEDVIDMLEEILPVKFQTRECWALGLEKLKEELRSAVNCIHQTLSAVCDYHNYYNKANTWYSLVLRDNFLPELLSGVHGDQLSAWRQNDYLKTVPAWRQRLFTFLKKNPPPDMEELLHLSRAIPDNEVQLAGRRLSQRCMILRKLLLSSGPVSVEQLQLALQWQYELLCTSHVNPSPESDALSDIKWSPSELNHTKCDKRPEAGNHPATLPSPAAFDLVSPAWKQPSANTFYPGLDSVGSTQLDALGRKDDVENLLKLTGNSYLMRPVPEQPNIHGESSSTTSDGEHNKKEIGSGPAENFSSASIQIIPKVEAESLNLEITVKRSAAPQTNPWLSLPVDDLENSYTVTITPKPTPQKKEASQKQSSEVHVAVDQESGCSDHLAQMEMFSCTEPREPQSTDWMLHAHSGLEDPERSSSCNILSSTFTDGRDGSICGSEGVPTLLWDSYDLHDEKPEADSVMDTSLMDWEVKEQENLREVERILNKADGILEEEENVLVQEAVLDALLRAGNTEDPWPLWGSEEQLDEASIELAESSVLSFEDCLQPDGSRLLSEVMSPDSTRESEACSDDDDDDLWTKAENTEGQFDNRRALVNEMKTVHDALDQMIKENLKIHDLRPYQGGSNNPPTESTPFTSQHVSVANTERGAFSLQLESEKREVRSSVEAPEGKDGAQQSGRYFDTDQSETDSSESGEPTDELPDGSDGGWKAAMNPQAKDVFEEKPSRSQGHDVGPSTSVAKGQFTIRVSSFCDLKESSVVVQPLIIRGKDLYESAPCIGENALTSGLMQHGEVDPGGNPALPVTEPETGSLPVSSPPAQHENPPPSEVCVPGSSLLAQDPAYTQHDLKAGALGVLERVIIDDRKNLFNPNVKEHNNNNNFSVHGNGNREPSEMTNVDEKDPSMVPVGLLQTDVEQTKADLQSVLKSGPNQPLEFDPSETEELTDWVQSSDSMRMSDRVAQRIHTPLWEDNIEIADFKIPVVLDIGSGLMKAGLANQHQPNITFPTITGVPKYEDIMNGTLEREIYVGDDAQQMRGVLTLNHPIKNGIICNWDDMEKIWQYTFQQLPVDPRDHPVLLTEKAMNPLENQQRMVEIMFEHFGVPFAYVAMQAVLALYAVGRTTGVVFDSGEGVSHSVPVFEGYSLPHAVQRFPLAGLDVTLQLKKLLQEQGVCMRTTAEDQIVREMKEKCCCVSLNYEAELNPERSSCREMHYTMPDGQIITLGTERFRAPEILFKPEMIGREHYGMHENIFKSIFRSDIDLRRSFLGNIVLSGGNTLLPGLPERLQAEIKNLVPADMGMKVCVTSPKDRDFLVWSGGAVLANLPTFSSAWISQGEYEEYGPQIVFRKCF